MNRTVNILRSFSRSTFVQRETANTEASAFAFAFLGTFGSDAWRSGHYLSVGICIVISILLYLNWMVFKTRVGKDVIRVRVGEVIPLLGFNIPLRNIVSLSIESPADKQVAHLRPGVHRHRVFFTYARAKATVGVFVQTIDKKYFIGSPDPQALAVAIEDAIAACRIRDAAPQPA